MIDIKSLRPTESRQINLKVSEEDREYLKRVHAFIDEQFDQLLVEIGEKQKPNLGRYAVMAGEGTLGRDQIKEYRKDAHHRLNYPFTYGPAYWLGAFEVYDQGVVGTVKLCEAMREQWGETRRETDIPKKIGSDHADVGRLHYEGLIRNK